MGILLIAIILLITAFIGTTAKKEPHISSINPPVGLPGDTLTIKGENFGSSRGSSYVELAGSRLTASGYTSWSDREIKITLPANVQDGLVVVGTSTGRSEPGFFANKAGIPVVIPADPQTTIPVITEISPLTASVGQLLTISGNNFGSVKGTSLVYFTSSCENQAPAQTVNLYAQNSSQPEFIPASDSDYDYELWSDTEIHVRVPDGAASGQIYIQTGKGESDSAEIIVSSPAGKKTFDTKRTYVIQMNADIINNDPDKESTITLYLPKPVVTASQPSSDMTEVYPDPLIKNDLHDTIFQGPLNLLINVRERFSHSFAVTVYEVNSSIKEQGISKFQNTSRLLYTAYTAADSCVPSSSDEITELKTKITGKERNPYRQAKLLYSWLLDNYELLPQIRTGDISVLDLIKDKKGDAYDFTMVFTALCRAAGIPAVPVSGILADSGSSTTSHWWTEIYFENYGWFPVDIALGGGQQFASFVPVDDPREYYFGNLDSQHIAFSRGWNQIKPSLLNSRTVYRPRTYALQSVWEEASNSECNYSSLWSNPVVIGIY